MNSPIPIEFDHATILLGWTPFPEALAYELQMQTNEEEWVSLSTSIRGCSIRKKNLIPGTDYRFRIRPQLPSGWDLFSDPTEVLHVLQAEVRVCDAPVLSAKDGGSVTIEWPEVEGCEGYSLRYRSENQLGWSTIDTVLKANRAKKKHLQPGEAYYFSVVPVGAGEDWSFSKSSQPLAVAQISQFMRNLFPNNLLAGGGTTVSTAEALAGKVVAVYFSAHW